jgi:hypothetical protein
MQLRAGTVVLTLLGGIGLAAGQGMPGDAGAQEKLNLRSRRERRECRQGTANDLTVSLCRTK